MFIRIFLASIVILTVAEAKIDFSSLANIGINKEEILTRIQEFFDLENAGQTELGKYLAWKGDLIQPLLVPVIGFVILIGTIQLLLPILSTLVDAKAGLIGNVISILSLAFQEVLNKLYLFKEPILNKLNAMLEPEDDDTSPAADRRRRAIDEAFNAVRIALEKYE